MNYIFLFILSFNFNIYSLIILNYFKAIGLGVKVLTLIEIFFENNLYFIYYCLILYKFTI